MLGVVWISPLSHFDFEPYARVKRWTSCTTYAFLGDLAEFEIKQKTILYYILRNIYLLFIYFYNLSHDL